MIQSAINSVAADRVPGRAQCDVAQTDYIDYR